MVRARPPLTIPSSPLMIGRIWHGWTKKGADAGAYESLLRTDVLPDIHRVPGFRGAHLLRRDAGDEVEFVTITWFDSMEAVRAFAGADETRAVIHGEAGKRLG